MSTSEERLKAALDSHISANGLKSSKQRDMVAEVFFTQKGHISVDELLREARERDPKISQATVYRTMKLLTEAGLAEPRRFYDNQTLYEPTDEDEHHDHLICTRCGKIEEFMEPRIEELQTEVAAQHGLKMHDHRMDLFGECVDRPACDERRSAKS